MMTNRERRRDRADLSLAGIAASAVLLSTLGIAGVATAQDSGASSSDASWVNANGDYANTRVATSSIIDSSNVAELGFSWTAPFVGAGSFGSFAAVPIIEDGIVYIQDLGSNVQAYDLASGELQWEMIYDSPSIGPNGLTIGDGRIYGTTADEVFALDAASGDEIWRGGLIEGEVGVAEGGTLGYTIQPAYRDGVLYLAEAAKAGGGDLLAVDGETGEVIWRFDTTVEPEGDLTPSGGAWGTPALDDDGNVYFGVANGYYAYTAPEELQNERLYTNSALKLDAETRELEWYYQTVPNDFWDWDLQLAPILTEIDGTEVALFAGKMGYIYAIDRATGELIWETPVGIHNGRDDDGQAQLDGTLELPEFPFDIYPGPLGGVETSMALSDGVVFAAVVNNPATITSEEDLAMPVPPADLFSGAGEIVALDVSSGEILWNTELETMPLGAMTVSNDLVFTTTFDGDLVAYSTEDGTEVWSQYLGAATNAPLAIVEDTLVTGAGFALSEDQVPQLVVMKLGAANVAPAAEEGSTAGATEATAVDEAALGTIVEVGVIPGGFSFDPETLTAPAGTVTFRFTNTENVLHNIAIRSGSEVIAASDLITVGSVDLTVELDAGEYEFICEPHVALGMVGDLTIT